MFTASRKPKMQVPTLLRQRAVMAVPYNAFFKTCSDLILSKEAPSAPTHNTAVRHHVSALTSLRMPLNQSHSMESRGSKTFHFTVNLLGSSKITYHSRNTFSNQPSLGKFFFFVQF